MIWTDAGRDPWSGTATVTRQTGPGTYLATDQGGRLRLVRSAETYRSGDRVSVLSGLIVGRAGRASAATIYEV